MHMHRITHTHTHISQGAREWICVGAREPFKIEGATWQTETDSRMENMLNVFKEEDTDSEEEEVGVKWWNLRGSLLPQVMCFTSALL